MQFATGLQTHALPRDPAMLERIARSLGYDGDATARCASSTRVRERRRRALRVARAGRRASDRARRSTGSLGRARRAATRRPSRPRRAAPFGCGGRRPTSRGTLLALARRPDWPARRDHPRSRPPAFARRLIDALADAADPEQAARLLAAFFARFATPGVYVRALADDPPGRARCARCSARARSSARRSSRTPTSSITSSSPAASPTPEVRARAGRRGGRVARRRTTRRTSTRSSGRCGAPSGASRSRSASPISPASSGRARSRTCSRRSPTRRSSTRAGSRCASARGDRRPRRRATAGGSRSSPWASSAGARLATARTSISSSSTTASDDDAPRALRPRRPARAPARRGRRTPRARLRARHAPAPVGQPGAARRVARGVRALPGRSSAESWERQALAQGARLRGDRRSARASSRSRTRRLRARRARRRSASTTCARAWSASSAHERLDRSPARYDLKVGRGGLVDVEFAAQWLQMRHGARPARAHDRDRGRARGARDCGYLDAALADDAARGLAFLRRLEQRLRVLHGTSVELLEEGAPGPRDAGAADGDARRAARPGRRGAARALRAR